MTVNGADRIAFLGPAGTFTEVALRSRPEAGHAKTVPMGSVDAVLAAVRAGEVEAGVVPIENSVEGGVPATLDSLATGQPLCVVAEMIVPITFALAARPGTSLSDIRAVSTHSHAWAQVRGWMAANLPDVAYLPATSTAAAAVGLQPGEAPPYDAAVCLAHAATDAGLALLAHDIGDNKEAVTRFVLVAKPGSLPAPTGADKSTVVLFQELDHPGGLLELLEQFKVRGINMTRLESRPTKESLGRYCFSIDFEGHIADRRVGEALMGLHRVCSDVRFIGSYPRADARSIIVTPQHQDRAYRDASDWLADLRNAAS